MMVFSDAKCVYFRTMAMNHDEMRLTVCCSCQKPGSKRSLTPQLLDLAKKFLFDGFDIDNPKLPIGLCYSCRGKLMRNTDPKTNPEKMV